MYRAIALLTVPLMFLAACGGAAEDEGEAASEGLGFSIIEDLDDELFAPPLPEKLLEGFFLDYQEVELPSPWPAGEVGTVKFRVISDLGCLPPGGSALLGIGYHWSDPDRTGSWDSIVWDDGNYAFLPDGLGPGQSTEVSLQVAAPDNPGESWALTFNPVVIDGPKRYWGPTTSHHTVRVNIGP